MLAGTTRERIPSNPCPDRCMGFTDVTSGRPRSAGTSLPSTGVVAVGGWGNYVTPSLSFMRACDQLHGGRFCARLNTQQVKLWARPSGGRQHHRWMARALLQSSLHLNERGSITVAHRAPAQIQRTWQMVQTIRRTVSARFLAKRDKGGVWWVKALHAGRSSASY
jgi:hypothetical protein